MSDEAKIKSAATSPLDEDFPSAGSPQQISAAPPAAASASPDNNAGDYDDDEFDFAFVVGDPEIPPSITADELFSEGRIRPIYPVFNRDLLLDDDVEKLCRQPLLKLLIEDRDASISHSSSSSEHDLKGIPTASYCVWKPGSAESPGTVRKSSSTGSSRRRWIKNFVVGRSHSDGKEKFMFLAAEGKRSMEKEVTTPHDGKRKGKEKKKSTELDLLTAHRMFYGQNGNGMTARSGSAAGRKSYLPYKPEIVGFFARVNGISRAHHPF